jgi:hypothetical protein
MSHERETVLKILDQFAPDPLQAILALVWIILENQRCQEQLRKIS